MIKKSFRLMLLVALALSSAMFVSCNKYDDDIERLDSAVAALQATVQTLQNEIAGGAVITNVTNTADGIKVTLSNGNSYNVQNGKDGQNGTNGKDGSVVEVGENGNWFINGEDTGLAAAGKDGKDGQNGTSASTVYYYPGEAGVWVKVTVSPEGEKTEEATTMKWLPAGTLTAVYENGALTLYGVQGVEGGLVVAGSAHLASLAFVPEVMTPNLGMPVVSSYYVQKYAGFDDEEEEEIWNKVLSNNLEMTYRVNPTNANLSKTVFSFIDRVVATKVDGDSTSLLNFVSYKAVEGGIVVTATANEIDYEADQDENHNIFALKAVNEDGCEIVSDYAKFEADVLDQFSLWCGVYNKKGAFEAKYEHLEIDNPALAEEVVGNLKVEVKDLTTLADIAKVDEAYDLSLVEEHVCGKFAYDGSFDLNKLVRLFAGEVDMAKADFDVTYKFSKPETYKSTEDKVTNQQYYVELSEDGIVTVNSALPTKRSAIGRTPIFKVEAYIGETLIADTYVKLQVLEVVPEDKDAVNIWVNGGVIEYSDIVSEAAATKKNPATLLQLTWDRVNAEIYEVLGMSPTQFRNIYNVPAWSHKVVESKKGVVKTGTPAGVIGHEYLTGNDEINTATTGAYISFEPASLKLGKDTVFVTFSNENSTVYGPVTVAFTYDIKHDKAFPALNSDYQVADHTIIDGKLNSKGKVEYSSVTLETVQTKGKLVNGKWALQNSIKEFIKNYAEDIEKVIPGNHSVPTFELVGVVYADTLREAAVNPVVWVKKSKYDVSSLGYGASLSDNTLENGELALTDALYAAEDYRLYVIRMTLEMANGGKCQKDFAVKFVRPYTMTVDAVTLKTMAAPDKADLSKLVTVKDFSGKVLYAINKNHPDYTVAKDGSINWDELGVTEYAEKYYGLTAADFANIVYGVDATGFGEGTLTTSGSELIWNNMGGDLQVNKSAKSEVTLTIEGIAATTAKGNVTVLSTANSMDAE